MAQVRGSSPFRITILNLKIIVNSISIDEQRSSSLIRGIRCGKLMPGVSVLKTLHLLNTGAGGDRVIDISVRSRPGRHETEEDGRSDGEDEHEDNYRHLDITETERTFVVPTIDPLKVTQDVVYRYSTQAWTGISGLRNYDADFWDGSKGSEAQINTKIEFAGPWDVEILRMEAQKEVKGPNRACSLLLDSRLRKFLICRIMISRR